MRKSILLMLLLATLAIALGYMVGGRLLPGPGAESRPGSVKVARPSVNGNETGLKEETVSVPADQDPVATALRAALQGDPNHPSAFPSGTKLVSVKVENDGVAVIEFSPEFNGLRNS